MIDRAAGEADPEGVIKGIGPLQASGQLLAVVEVQGMALYPVAEGAEGRRVTGEGTDGIATVQ